MDKFYIFFTKVICVKVKVIPCTILIKPYLDLLLDHIYTDPDLPLVSNDRLRIKTDLVPVSISEKTSYREISSQNREIGSLSHHFEIWQAHRQQCCRCACQISERSDNSKYKSRGFETLRNRTTMCLIGYWNGGPRLVLVQSNRV